MIDNPSLNSLKQEMFMILQLCWVEQRLSFKLVLNPEIVNEPDFLAVFYSIQVINNEITFRLNKFYDKRKDSCSLYSVIKELQKTKRSKLNPNLDSIKSEIDDFSKTEFANVKARRDEKLAHLKKGQNNSWQEGSFVLNAVHETMNFLDKLNGAEIEYLWQDFRLKTDLDLRHIF